MAFNDTFALDARWHWLRGEMETSKKPDLLTLLIVLAKAQQPFAIIGGVALQLHVVEPRTTLDIDIAVPTTHPLPREVLLAAGFTHVGTFEHSDNWRGPQGTPVQVSCEAAFDAAVAGAEGRSVDGVRLPVVKRADLLRLKITAARDHARRSSKRLQDWADVQTLLELDPALAQTLSESDRAELAKLIG